MATKKVVIIIVEGLSDSTSLDRYLKMIKKDSKIFYHIIRGDITKEKDMARHTAKKLMGNCLNKFFKDNIYGIKKKDVKEIVHLVDLDGTFISGDLVKKEENALAVIYGEEDIKYIYNEYLIEKNMGFKLNKKEGNKENRSIN